MPPVCTRGFEKAAGEAAALVPIVKPFALREYVIPPSWFGNSDMGVYVRNADLYSVKRGRLLQILATRGVTEVRYAICRPALTLAMAPGNY